MTKRPSAGRSSPSSYRSPSVPSPADAGRRCGTSGHPRPHERPPTPAPAGTSGDPDGVRSPGRPAPGKRPVSEKRAAANRANARRSTGPRSIEGKRRSRLNAVRHGLWAETALLPGESGDELSWLSTEFELAYGSADPVERALATRLVAVSWKLRRLARAEAVMAAQAQPVRPVVPRDLLGPADEDRDDHNPDPDLDPDGSGDDGPIIDGLAPGMLTGGRVLADDFATDGRPGRLQQLLNAEIRLTGQMASICRLLLRAREKPGDRRAAADRRATIDAARGVAEMLFDGPAGFDGDGGEDGDGEGGEVDDVGNDDAAATVGAGCRGEDGGDGDDDGGDGDVRHRDAGGTSAGAGRQAGDDEGDVGCKGVTGADPSAGDGGRVGRARPADEPPALANGPAAGEKPATNDEPATAPRSAGRRPVPAPRRTADAAGGGGDAPARNEPNGRPGERPVRPAGPPLGGRRTVF